MYLNTFTGVLATIETLMPFQDIIGSVERPVYPISQFVNPFPNKPWFLRV